MLGERPAKKMVGFIECAMPADGISRCHSPRRRSRRHVPSRKAALKKITGSHAHPKDHQIASDVAQTIQSNGPMSVMGHFASVCASADHFRGRDASYLAPPAQIRTGPI